MNVAPFFYASSAGPGFNGLFHEPATGWQMLGNGYRVYNPVLIRFHSPDNQSPFGRGGLNAYAYCAGDPVNRVDPSGHSLLLSVMKHFRDADGLFDLLAITAVKGREEQAVQRTLVDLAHIESVRYYVKSELAPSRADIKRLSRAYQADPRPAHTFAKKEIAVALRAAHENFEPIRPFYQQLSRSVKRARRADQLITPTAQVKFQQASDAIRAHWTNTKNLTAINTVDNALASWSADTAVTAIRQSGRSNKSVRFRNISP